MASEVKTLDPAAAWALSRGGVFSPFDIELYDFGDFRLTAPQFMLISATLIGIAGALSILGALLIATLCLAPIGLATFLPILVAAIALLFGWIAAGLILGRKLLEAVKVKEATPLVEVLVGVGHEDEAFSPRIVEPQPVAVALGDSSGPSDFEAVPEAVQVRIPGTGIQTQGNLLAVRETVLVRIRIQGVGLPRIPDPIVVGVLLAVQESVVVRVGVQMVAPQEGLHGVVQAVRVRILGQGGAGGSERQDQKDEESGND